MVRVLWNVLRREIWKELGSETGTQEHHRNARGPSRLYWRGNDGGACGRLNHGEGILTSNSDGSRTKRVCEQLPFGSRKEQGAGATQLVAGGQ